MSDREVGLRWSELSSRSSSSALIAGRAPAAFIDETGATTNMIRRQGWAPSGERLVDAAPLGR